MTVPSPAAPAERPQPTKVVRGAGEKTTEPFENIYCGQITYHIVHV